MTPIEINSPGEIFSGNRDTLKSEYDRLVRQYHPDVNKSPNAHDEFIHLQELYKRAQEELKEGFWEGKGTLEFSKYRAKFMRKVTLPIGIMYIGDLHVTFFIDKKHKNLWDNAIKMISGFKYPSEKMKNEVSRYLPSARVTVELPNYYVLVLYKTPDLILLRDIPNTIPDWDRHVAWIISSLHNLLCYFEIAGITHNDISLDTYFISPTFHSGVLLGGWWYARTIGDRLLSVPTTSYDLFSPAMKKAKMADHFLDKELLRAVGRELLGDRMGTRLSNTIAPAPLINWLKCASSESAVKEYQLWDNVLKESYGGRKFIPMDVSIKTIYGGK